MARIRDYVVTEFPSNTNPWMPSSMPTHEAGDLLLAIWGKDDTSGLTPTGTTGGGSGSWTQYENLNSSQANGGIHACRATSNDASYSGTLSTDTGILIVISITEVYGTTLADCINLSESGTSDSTTIPFQGLSGFSTTYDGELVFDIFFSDGGTSPTAYAPLRNICADDAGSGSLCVAYRYIDTAGAIPQSQFFGRANDDGRALLISIRPSNSNDSRSAYSDPNISIGQVLRPIVGLTTTQSDSWPSTTNTTIMAMGAEWDSAQLFTGSFTDVTSEANNRTTADISLGTSVGNILYLGYSEPFDRISYNLSTQRSGGTLVMEYYNGTSWVSVAVLQATSNAILGGGVYGQSIYRMPSDWAQTTINSITKYWFRYRITVSPTVGPVISYITRGGSPITYITATASADNGVNPYNDAAGNIGAGATPNISTAGFEYRFGSPLDLQTGILYSTYRGAIARDLAIDIYAPKYPGDIAGLGINLYDSSLNEAIYYVGGKASKDISVDGRNAFAIALNDGAIQALERSSAIDKSDITTSFWWTYGFSGAVSIVWSMFNLVSKIAIAGGNSTIPLNIDDLVGAVNNSIGLFPFMNQIGESVEVLVPLQIGGGDPVGMDMSGVVFQYPKKYDGFEYFRWNAPDNIAGVLFKPKSGDYLNFRGAQWLCKDKSRWEWDTGSATSGWTGDFSNIVLKNQTVVFDSAFNVAESNNMTFEECTIAQNGTTLANSFFADSLISCDTLDDMALLSDNTFSSSGSGHAIEVIGSADTITFIGNSFEGFAVSDGSTGDEAIYINISSGTVTINISGGGSTPSIRTAGATVVINNSVTLTLTGLVSGSDIVILDTGTTDERANVDSNGTSTYDFSYSYSVSDYVDICVYKQGYVPYIVRNYLLGSSDSSLPISQTIDRNFIS